MAIRQHDRRRVSGMAGSWWDCASYCNVRAFSDSAAASLAPARSENAVQLPGRTKRASSVVADCRYKFHPEWNEPIPRHCLPDLNARELYLFAEKP